MLNLLKRWLARKRNVQEPKVPVLAEPPKPSLGQRSRVIAETDQALFTPASTPELPSRIASPEATPSLQSLPIEDPRIKAFREAHTPEERQRVAARYPELRPPHAWLSKRENALLEYAYWQGLTYGEAAKAGGFSAKNVNRLKTRALRKLVKRSET